MENKELITVFSDIKLVGEYDSRSLTAKLDQIGEGILELSDRSDRSKSPDELLRFFGLIKQQPWMQTTHQFGYIALRQSGSTEPQVIEYPGSIAADTTLKNKRINIRLDRLRVYKYPGRGIHNIMVSFAARNQVADSQESVTFSQTYRVAEGQMASIAGYPIFIGLNVGSQGVAFECSTVNVNNETDQAILAALESPPFQSGLSLLTTAQPAIAPFTEITLGVVKALARRTENVPVQKFYLGLDFENAAMGIRLKEGNYIAAQVPSETAIEWHKWEYRPDIGTIVHKADRLETLPYNYLVFRVSRYEA
ncbi:hypothetical protein [Nostoc edaphicum]|uniref:hypothetical protein n=1 Tax=Nostoc edaphicum TaxID=264686 RepID=UPI001D14FFDF|nr:hypothetical protein [Nostoc edaphicum]